MQKARENRPVSIGPIGLKGLLTVPSNAIGLVIFAHGSGSGRLSPRNNYVAQRLSSGGGAALVAAAGDERIGAVVSRGGRPDLAGPALPHVAAPTLLIVGSLDGQVIELNRYAEAHMRCERQVAIVQGASHLFEEPGTLDQVVILARGWFVSHLQAAKEKSRGT